MKHLWTSRCLRSLLFIVVWLCVCCGCFVYNQQCCVHAKWDLKIVLCALLMCVVMGVCKEMLTNNSHILAGNRMVNVYT